MNIDQGWQKDYPTIEEISEESLDDNSSLKKMLNLIGEGKKVVDFGCATGYFSNLLKKKGCMVTGVEINSEAAKIAEQYCERVIVSDLDFESVKEILPEQKFDVAIFGDVLEHLRNPWKVLEDTKQILKEDGYVVASIPNIAHASIRLSLLQGNFDYTDLGILDNTHIRFFTRKTVKHLFERAGYLADIVDCTKLDCFAENHLIPYNSRYEFSLDTIRKIEEDQDCDTLQFIIRSYPCAQSQLQQTQDELKQTQDELKQTQSQLQQTQDELKQTQSQLQQTQSELERSQSQLQHTQSELVNSQSQLQHTQSQLNYYQLEYQNAYTTVLAMKTSKFWKLRKIWFKVKSLLSSTSKDIEAIPAQFAPQAEERLEGQSVERFEEQPVDFDSEYYLAKYTDIRQAGIDPYQHYVLHGRAEGRTGTFNVEKVLQQGLKTYNPEFKTILVVCHEASRTGAPILGLELVRSLAKDHNVITWLGKTGEIMPSFVENSNIIINTILDEYDALLTLDYIQESFHFEVAICNSASTMPISKALYRKKVPILSLVHEYADYASNDVLGSIESANRVVFPSNDVRNSAIKKFQKKWGSLPEKTVVCHQGFCIPPKAEEPSKVITRDEIIRRIRLNKQILCSSEQLDRPIIVLGCGSIQIRKGIDYFVQAAQLCQQKTSRPIKFIWVGDGYDPEVDLNYSVWIQSQISRSKLEENVFFFEPVDDLSPFFDIADVFFLSSRLDPFPNVAIDAVKAQVPVLTFENSTGFAEFIQVHPVTGVVVSYLDIESIANAIISLSENYKETPELKHSKQEEYLKVYESLNFEKYKDFILSQCKEVVQEQKNIEIESKTITKAGILNKTFFRSAYSVYEWDKIFSEEYVYVSNWVRGIRCAKSLPGFNDCMAQDSVQNMTHLTPLGEIISLSKTPQTHEIIAIDLKAVNVENKEINSKVALHIHAYHEKRLSSLLERLLLLKGRVDIYITTDSQEKAKYIFKSLDTFGFKEESFFIKVVPNIGRDVAPFIMTMKDVYHNYEIIGHLHIKQTRQLELTTVEQWQKFLYDNLLGVRGEVALKILENFLNDETLGLVFPEDSCMPSWNANYDLAVKLATRLGLTLELPQSLQYPMGNMFWARTEAIIPLLQQNWQWSDFPSEPIPYDGTLLHALERLTPFICQRNYVWKTSYVSGTGRYNKSVELS